MSVLSFSLSWRRAVSLLLVTCVVFFLMGNRPASAANLGTVTFDCAIGVDVTITADPGDTVTVDAVNCGGIGVRSWDLPLQNSDFSLVGGLFVLNPTTITVPASFTGLWLVSWRTVPTNAGIKLSINSGSSGSSGGGSVSSGSGPLPVIQEVPVPAGGCSAVVDDWLQWGTGVSGGWVRVWGDWANAWVCGRMLAFRSAGWVVA